MTSRNIFILLTAILGSSVVMLGESVATLALPSIARSFEIPFSALQWVVDGYNLTLSALILFGGSLGDSLGLRRVYLASTAAFLVISLACSLAWSAPSLILLRALLGMAGALLTPVSLAILNRDLPPDLRSRGIGYWTAATSIVLALGPLIGGYLVDLFSWRAIFLANLPLALAGLALGFQCLGPEGPRKRLQIDWAGALLGFLALAGITYGLIEGPAQRWSLATILPLATGGACLAVFVLWERHAKNPLVDLSLFRSVVFSATNAATFLLYAGFAGFGFVFNVFLQTTAGYSPTETGAVFIPTSILLALFSGRVGDLASRWGPQWFMTIGPLLCGLGMLMVIHLSPSVSFATDILPAVMVFSVGLVLTVAPLTSLALSSAPEEKSGIASAINNGTSTVGALIAIALLGLFGSGRAYTFSILLCAGLAFASAATSFLFIARKSQPQPGSTAGC